MIIKKINSKNKIEILKNQLYKQSKQAINNIWWSWVKTPEISFSALNNLYYWSYIVSWITDLLAKSCLSWFICENKELLKKVNDIDLYFLIKNKIISWNAFFEIIRNWKDEITRLIPFLNEWMERMIDFDWYIQRNWNEKIYFNQFTKNEEKLEKIQIWENSKAWVDSLANTGKWCWFNPNLNELYHFKNNSLKTRYFGESFFKSCLEQIILLEQIDNYFSNWFENWMIKSKFIFSKNWEWFSESDAESLKLFLEDKVKWVKKSFSATVLDSEIGYIDIEHDIDANAFIQYRLSLLKSVAICLNIPFDILDSINSNKATSQIAFEMFNKNAVEPIQKEILKDLKEIFSDDYPTDIETLHFVKVDTTDDLEQMNVLTGYAKNWIMTKNEVREKLLLSPVDGWDVLENNNNNNFENLFKKEKNFINVLNQIENDLYKNL